MIKRPAHKVKLIIKGPWADTSLQALLNTYEGALLHSLSRKERYRVGILEGPRQIDTLSDRGKEGEVG